MGDGTPARCLRWLATVCLAVLVVPSATEAAGAREIVETTGIRGGLVVHLGCGDGTLTAALKPSDSYLVHGLDRAAKHVAAARKHIRKLGLYGPVAVARLRGARLPYADNLVSLVIAENLGGVPMAEVLRVLRPEGVAYVKADGQWTKRTKPRPKDIDTWTHYLHGPNNNAVAHDAVVASPHRVQWVGEPKWARHHNHLSSLSAMVCSGGRWFAIVDEGPIATLALPPEWKLVARDAFSGVVLWKRDVGPWEGHLRPFRSGPTELARRLVAVGDRVYVTLGYNKPLVALDAATGKTLHTYEGTKGTVEILCAEGVLYLVAGTIDSEAYATTRRRSRPS
ncbi:MAG: methyltransferase domain-containing protein, partial [Planctomycetota bacterium]